jgi:hypothetical protein
MGRFQYKMPKRQFADFHVNYYTGQKMLKGENIYDADAYRRDKIAIFKYPPLFALITALFALTTERTAATAWFTFNFLLIILFIFYSGRMIFKDKLFRRQKNWIYFLVLFLTSRFYMDNFDEGQVNLLMMTALFLGIYFSQKNKNFLAGLSIGFSILVKYMSAIFIPYFLFKKRFKLVFYILISLILFSLLPALFLGWSKNLSLQSQYLSYLAKTSLDFYSLSDFANQSIFSMFMRFFSSYGQPKINFMNLGDYFLGILTGGFCIFLYILCLLPNRGIAINKKSRLFNNIDIGLLSICVALFNPNAWLHAFIFLTFGYMAALFYLFNSKPIDKTVLLLTILSFIFHSFTGDFFTKWWAENLFEYYSSVTIGALFLFIALLKIKFFPLKSLEQTYE